MDSILKDLLSKDLNCKLKGLEKFKFSFETIINQGDKYIKHISACLFLIKDSNFKVSALALDVFKEYLQINTIPPPSNLFETLLFKLIDNKPNIRNQAKDVLILYITKYDKKGGISRLMSTLSSRNVCLKEGILDVIKKLKSSCRTEFKDSVDFIEKVSLGLLDSVSSIRSQTLDVLIDFIEIYPDILIEHVKTIPGLSSIVIEKLIAHNISLSNCPVSNLVSIPNIVETVIIKKSKEISENKVENDEFLDNYSDDFNSKTIYSRIMEDSPAPLYISKERELEEIFEIIGIDLQKNEDWTKRNNALITLQALCKGNLHDYSTSALSYLKKLTEKISLNITDLRSVISKEACKSVALLFYSLKSSLIPLLETWWISLTRVLLLKIQVMSKAADKAIRLILTTCFEPKLITLLINSYSTKASSLRQYIIEYFCLISIRWPQQTIEKLQDILSLLKISLTDPDSNVRKYSKYLSWLLAVKLDCKKTFQNFLKELDSVTIKYLQIDPNQKNEFSSIFGFTLNSIEHIFDISSNKTIYHQDIENNSKLSNRIKRINTSSLSSLKNGPKRILIESDESKVHEIQKETSLKIVPPNVNCKLDYSSYQYFQDSSNILNSLANFCDIISTSSLKDLESSQFINFLELILSKMNESKFQPLANHGIDIILNLSQKSSKTLADNISFFLDEFIFQLLNLTANSLSQERIDICLDSIRKYLLSEGLIIRLINRISDDMTSPILDYFIGLVKSYNSPLSLITRKKLLNLIIILLSSPDNDSPSLNLLLEKTFLEIDQDNIEENPSEWQISLLTKSQLLNIKSHFISKECIPSLNYNNNSLFLLKEILMIFEISRTLNIPFKELIKKIKDILLSTNQNKSLFPQVFQSILEAILTISKEKFLEEADILELFEFLPLSISLFGKFQDDITICFEKKLFENLIALFFTHWNTNLDFRTFSLLISDLVSQIARFNYKESLSIILNLSFSAYFDRKIENSFFSFALIRVITLITRELSSDEIMSYQERIANLTTLFLDKPEIELRQAAILLLAEIYSKIRENILPYLETLNISQRKLIMIYAHKKSTSNSSFKLIV